jgi:hypothetical protein
VTAGVESYWWRDVARSGPPVEASPVSWEGSGPVVFVAHDRGTRSRLHHFEGAFASAGGAELRSPVRAVAVPDDSASRLTGRYEYRRYPWRDLWTQGLDVGFGVAGSGERLIFDRHFDPSIELRRSTNQLGSAFVLAARWQRSARWALETVWGNGITVGRATSRYRSELEATRQQWGGGWQTNLDLHGEVRVTANARVTAGWFSSGEGRFESHDGQTYGRSRFTLGVVYDR